MDNPLSKLSLDYWYQVIMVVCALVFLLCGSGLLKAFPVLPTALMSAGGFFIGMGEWINHPLQTGLLRATVYNMGGVITSHPRNNSFLGVVFVLAGLGLVAVGAYKALT